MDDKIQYLVKQLMRWKAAGWNNWHSLKYIIMVVGGFCGALMLTSASPHVMADPGWIYISMIVWLFISLHIWAILAWPIAIIWGWLATRECTPKSDKDALDKLIDGS